MTLTVGSYYGLSRDTCAQINALAKRVNAHAATVPADIFINGNFGGAYTMNRFKAANLDKVAAAIAASDSQKPNFIMGTHYHFGGRAFFARLVALEARATVLGW